MAILGSRNTAIRWIIFNLLPTLEVIIKFSFKINYFPTARSPHCALHARDFALVLALVSAAGPCWAGHKTGTSAARFLKMGAGARSLAMGEASSAASEDAESIYWNPAALTRLHRRSVALTHASNTGTESLELAAFGQSLGTSNAWGVGVLYRSAGRLAHTDEAGLERGGFTPSDLAVSLSAAHDLDEFSSLPFLSALSLGVTVKYIESKILNSARTWAADLGVLTPPQLNGRLRLAAVLKNLGGELKYESNPEPLPLEGRLGAALRLSPAWLFSLDAVFARDGDPAAGVGGEYGLRFGRSQALAARAGFHSRSIGEVEGFTGISFGAGWSYGQLGLDYAALPFGSLGVAHRFTLRAEF